MVWSGGEYECELFLDFLFEASFSRLEYTSRFGLTAARARCRGPFPFGGDSLNEGRRRRGCPPSLGVSGCGWRGGVRCGGAWGCGAMGGWRAHRVIVEARHAVDVDALLRVVDVGGEIARDRASSGHR
eukprot:scaffold5910_cov103-Isochrysis_galbana.AAC.9